MNFEQNVEFNNKIRRMVQDVLISMRKYVNLWHLDYNVLFRKLFPKMSSIISKKLESKHGIFNDQRKNTESHRPMNISTVVTEALTTFCSGYYILEGDAQLILQAKHLRLARYY